MFLEIDEYALKKEQNLNWIIITQQTKTEQRAPSYWQTSK